MLSRGKKLVQLALLQESSAESLDNEETSLQEVNSTKEVPSYSCDPTTIYPIAEKPLVQEEADSLKEVASYTDNPIKSKGLISSAVESISIQELNSIEGAASNNCDPIASNEGMEIICPVIGVQNILDVSSIKIWNLEENIKQIIQSQEETAWSEQIQNNRIFERNIGCQMEDITELTVDTPSSASVNNSDIKQLNQTVKLNRKAKVNAMSNRVKGKSYLGLKKGSIVISKDSRKMKGRCNHKELTRKTDRTFLCGKVSDEERSKLFSEFWMITTWPEKRGYVRGLVNTRNVTRRRKRAQEITAVKDRKSTGHDIYLGTPDGDRLCVCRQFFINTLGIGEDCFRRWTSNDSKIQMASINEESEEEDDLQKTLEGSKEKQFEKGGQEPSKVSRKEKKMNEKMAIENWLAVLPKVPSHYCRASSQKLYVESTFRSKLHMYSLYTEWCEENGSSPASRTTFMETLETCNIAIHSPRKDQCDICCSFKIGELKEEEYAAHLLRKDQAREAKNRAKEDSSDEHVVITMDLQSVLLCPKLLASKFYYKQKLQLHNFTIYELHNAEVKLYVWHEANGGVSANEFTTCITDYIRNIPEVCKKVTLISDGCNYQNRNKVLSSALSDMARLKGIKIEQIFLEKGHTMMECDSVHATLERIFTPPINSPMDYIARMRQTRPKKPYDIKNVDFSFFMNFESQETNLASLRPGKKCGDPVVTNVCQLQYLPDGTIHYKLQHNEDWTVFQQRRKLGTPLEGLKSLYMGPLAINQTKFNHLQELKLVIECGHHAFYDNLKVKPDKRKS